MTLDNTAKYLFLNPPPSPKPRAPPARQSPMVNLFSFHFLAYLPVVVLRLLIPTFVLLPPQSAIRLNENASKISQLKDDQEECETRLEKERDIYASNMFDLLAEEDNISSYIINYVKCESPTLSAAECI